MKKLQESNKDIIKLLCDMFVFMSLFFISTQNWIRSNIFVLSLGQFLYIKFINLQTYYEKEAKKKSWTDIIKSVLSPQNVQKWKFPHISRTWIGLGLYWNKPSLDPRKLSEVENCRVSK